MTERGLRIDEPRRQRMLADLDAARGPLEAETTEFVTRVVLPASADRLNPAKAHLFRERLVCKCCRNGKGKRDACWACAGFDKKPGVKQLREPAQTDVQRDIPESLLAPCAKCGGAGVAERDVFNPGSPQQVAIVLYDLLRLPVRTKDGKPRADEEALKSLLADAKPEAAEFIKKLLKLGKMDTIRSILERIAPDTDGKIRSVYNPAGTETGRFASSETFLVRSTNLNNLPKREVTDPMFDVRACVIPDDGCVFVEADYSGAESWIVAACSKDEALLQVLRSGIKVHRWTAARALGKPEAEVTEQEYMLYKTARHSLDGGMQWMTFMRNVNFVADRTGVAINAATAKAVCANYHALHPNLEAVWWKDVMRMLTERGAALTTCFGRKRVFYGRQRGDWLGETHREAIRQEPQSTVADLLNRGLLRWWRQHDGRVGELLAQVYDSVLIQTPRAKAKLCAELVRRCLTEPITVHGITITIPVDVKVCESWAVLKPEEAKAA